MKTSSVIVSMPEDYDGLVFSVVPESASYSENVATGETLGVLDSYVVALELPFDVQDALNFRVCAY